MKNYFLIFCLSFSTFCFAPIGHIEPWKDITLTEQGTFVYWGDHLLKQSKQHIKNIRYVIFNNVDGKKVFIPLTSWNNLTTEQKYILFPRVALIDVGKGPIPKNHTLGNIVLNNTVIKRLKKDRKEMCKNCGVYRSHEILGKALEIAQTQKY